MESIDIYYDGIGNMILLACYSGMPIRGVLMSKQERTDIVSDCRWIRADEMDMPISMMPVGDIEACGLIMQYGEPRIRLYNDEIECNGELSDDETKYIQGWEKALQNTFR